MRPDLPKGLAHRLEAVRSQYLQTEEAVTAFKVLFPMGLGVLYLVSIPLLYPSSWESFSGFLVAYFVPPAGKESVIPLAVGAGFSPLAIAGYVAAADAIVGLWIVWNYELATEVPLLRRAVLRAQESGESFIENRPWVEDVAFAGLTVFVMIPFQGSGAVAGAFVGRTISMPAERVWYAIIIGATVGSLAIAYLGQGILFAFQQALGTGIAVVVGFALVVAAGILLYLRGGQKRHPPR